MSKPILTPEGTEPEGGAGSKLPAKKKSMTQLEGFRLAVIIALGITLAIITISLL